jgi:hypothetical protein
MAKTTYAVAATLLHDWEKIHDKIGRQPSGGYLLRPVSFHSGIC